jgi:hypothetical protein
MPIPSIAPGVIVGFFVLFAATDSYAIDCGTGAYVNSDGGCTVNGDSYCQKSAPAGAGRGRGISCNNNLTSGCCFNNVDPQWTSRADHGFFCCPKGSQCVNSGTSGSIDGKCVTP